MNHQPQPRPRRGAFTLAEVTLALGITAIGMIALIGLIPSGLESLRQSSALVAEAKIVQAIVADYQTGDRTGRAEGLRLEDRTYHFDASGIRVQASDPWRHYTARARVVEEQLPVSGDHETNKYLQRLQIRITDHHDPAAAFADPQLHKEHGTIVALIDQTGREF